MNERIYVVWHQLTLVRAFFVSLGKRRDEPSPNRLQPKASIFPGPRRSPYEPWGS